MSDLAALEAEQEKRTQRAREALNTGRQPAIATPVAAVIAATLRWFCPETVSKTPPAYRIPLAASASVSTSPFGEGFQPRIGAPVEALMAAR